MEEKEGMPQAQKDRGRVLPQMQYSRRSRGWGPPDIAEQGGEWSSGWPWDRLVIL